MMHYHFQWFVQMVQYVCLLKNKMQYFNTVHDTVIYIGEGPFPILNLTKLLSFKSNQEESYTHYKDKL